MGKKRAQVDPASSACPGWLPPFVELLFPMTGASHEPLIDDLLIQHADYKRIMEALSDLDDLDRAVLCEHGLLITGESRLGKTRLLAEYIAEHMPYRTPNGLVIPVLYVEVPESPSVKNMSVALLREFGEVPGSRETADSLLGRIVTLGRNTSVRVICFDDLHHFVDQRGIGVQYELTEWLKRLVIQMRAAVVICGLDRTEAAIRLNEQLYGRMDAKLRLRRFDWRKAGDRKQVAQIAQGVHKSLEREFTLPECDQDFVFRWYCACAGRMGLLVKITRRAIKIARRTGSGTITQEILHLAWLRSVFDASGESASLQPFGEEFSSHWDERTITRIMAYGKEEPVPAPRRRHSDSGRRRKRAVGDAMQV